MFVFYRISSFTAVLTKPGDWSFLFYWKKLKIVTKFPSLKPILILSSKSTSMSIFLKSFLPLLSQISYFLLQVDSVCCLSLPAPFTCPKIFREKQWQECHCLFLYYFLNRLIYAWLKHVHSDFTALQLLDFPPDLTQRRFLSY
jgi:hypothetical protein